MGGNRHEPEFIVAGPWSKVNNVSILIDSISRVYGLYIFIMDCAPQLSCTGAPQEGYVLRKWTRCQT
jgi:hypothetical protein